MLQKNRNTGVYRILILSFLLLIKVCASAQIVANPFDLGKQEVMVADSSRKVLPAETNGNPFELLPGSSSTAVIPEKSAVEKIPELQQVPQSEKPQPFLFAIVVTILLLLTIMVSVSRTQIKKIYRAFFNDIVLKSLYREKGSVTTSIYVSLYLMFIVNLGIFIYLSLRQYNLLFDNSDLATLLYCILGTGTLIIVKHLVLGLLSAVFPVSKDMDTYSFVILIFGILTGLVLAPSNVFLAYADPGFAKLIITGTAIFLLIFYLILMLRSLFLVRNYIALHFFHFLLYLCTIEVVPILLLYKIISHKLQVPVLY